MSDALNIEYDEQGDVLTIDGIRYSGEVFRGYALSFPLNVPFELISRDDGVITIHRLEENPA